MTKPTNNIKKTKEDLGPFNGVIQVCPDCGKLDVYYGDNHPCNREMEQERQHNLEYYD